MKTGFIKLIRPEGWGFIECAALPKDVFFHKSDLINPKEELERDDHVWFDTIETPKGLKAINIRKD